MTAWSDETPWGLTRSATAWLVASFPFYDMVGFRCFKRLDASLHDLDAELVAHGSIEITPPATPTCRKCRSKLVDEGLRTPVGNAVLALLFSMSRNKHFISGAELLASRVPPGVGQNSRIAALHFTPYPRNPVNEAIALEIKRLRLLMGTTHCVTPGSPPSSGRWGDLVHG